jgi:hypothetical protein
MDKAAIVQTNNRGPYRYTVFATWPQWTYNVQNVGSKAELAQDPRKKRWLVVHWHCLIIVVLIRPLFAVTGHRWRPLLYLLYCPLLSYESPPQLWLQVVIRNPWKGLVDVLPSDQDPLPLLMFLLKLPRFFSLHLDRFGRLRYPSFSAFASALSCLLGQ